jgi:hypothetical protein
MHITHTHTHSTRARAHTHTHTHTHKHTHSISIMRSKSQLFSGNSGLFVPGSASSRRDLRQWYLPSFNHASQRLVQAMREMPHLDLPHSACISMLPKVLVESRRYGLFSVFFVAFGSLSHVRHAPVKTVSYLCSLYKWVGVSIYGSGCGFVRAKGNGNECGSWEV